jgi:hypothetical protein
MNDIPVQQAVPTPKKSNKTMIIGIMVFVILCCLCAITGAAAGYFGFQTINSGELIKFEYNSPSDENNAEVTIAPQKKSSQTAPKPGKTPQKPTVHPLDSKDGVSSGEEIRSEEGGYAFKTIPDYKLTINDIIPGHIFMDAKDKVVVKIGAKDGPKISMFGQLIKNDVTIDAYAKSYNDSLIRTEKATITDEQAITIAGQTGKVFDYEYEISEIGKIKARAIFIEVKPKQFFLVECYSPTDKWEKTQADFKVVTDSLTFFDAKPKK